MNQTEISWKFKDLAVDTPFVQISRMISSQLKTNKQNKNNQDSMRLLKNLRSFKIKS